ncbi:DUF2922 domain-containing protein [Kosmotoga sp. DU53]|uniref:DUF2922 domain-containing protein n=1 Tax=Kosmotoga sp. DU53 TaxID=1310160 RepID=UPI0007C46596|nr:DUF2922 domain-containing protein [Kosmotoga sp. DU53]OAA25172.1 hypothetical protein DU53_00350 [Kosmotoga sp. DU53]
MQTLNMRWYDAAQGKSKGIVLRSPRTDLTQTEVQAVMDNLVALKVIPSNYVTDYASIIDRTSNELFNLI